MAENQARRHEAERDLRNRFLRFYSEESAELSPIEHEIAGKIVNLFDEMSGDAVYARGAAGDVPSNSEQYFAGFLDHAPVALLVLDGKGALLFAQGSALPGLGCIREQVLGKPVTESCREIPWLLEVIHQARSTGKFSTTTGEARENWYHVQCAPILDASGAVARIFVFVVDATERKNLEVLEEQRAAAFTASLDGMAILDADQRYVALNEAHFRIYGYESADEFIGQRWEFLYEPGEAERLRNFILPSVLAKGSWQGEAVGRKKDGTRFPQEISLSRVRGGGLICVVRDITERKKTDRRQLLLNHASVTLSQSLDLGEMIKTVSMLAIPEFADYCVLRLDTGAVFASTKVLGARQTLDPSDAEELREIEAAVPEGGPVLKTFPAGDAPEIFRKLGIQSRCVVPLRARNIVLGSVILLREGSHPEGPFTEADYDVISNLVNRAALAIENSRLFQEANEAVRIRENLMATVSHDLKNPVTSVSINAEVLQKLSSGPVSGSQLQRVAKNLKVAADRMSSLIRQLLDFEKLRTGRLVLEKRPARLSRLIEELVTIFNPLSERKSIRLETKLAPTLETLYCDPDRILQVLSNLVGNALKFTAKGGRVSVEVDSRRDELLFSVSDTGSGLSPQELEHVFEVYWQAQPTAKEGSGLGLAIAKGIVEAHGGRIWARSQKGVGSTFSFSIPSAKAAARDSGSASPPRSE